MVRLENVCNFAVQSADVVPGAALLERFLSSEVLPGNANGPRHTPELVMVWASMSESGEYALQAGGDLLACNGCLQLTEPQRLCQVLPAQDNIGLI